MAVRQIDRNALHAEISKWKESVIYKDWVQSAIAHAPTLTPANDFTPVRHGRWIKPALGDGENYCSVCHAEQPWFYGYGYYNSDYCPNCGACMDAKEALKDADD